VQAGFEAHLGLGPADLGHVAVHVAADCTFVLLGELVPGVVTDDASQIQGVLDDVAFDFEVEGTAAGQTGRQIDLEQPGLHFVVNQNVEALQFEEVGFERHVLADAVGDGVFDRNEGLDHNFVDLG